LPRLFYKNQKGISGYYYAEQQMPASVLLFVSIPGDFSSFLCHLFEMTTKGNVIGGKFPPLILPTYRCGTGSPAGKSSTPYPRLASDERDKRQFLFTGLCSCGTAGDILILLSL